MRLSIILWLAVVGTLTLAALGTAEATNLALDVTGEFGPTTTLNGTALGANTPFSFHAVFDPAEDVNPTPGAGYFRPTEFAIEIAGHGSFAGVPNVDLNVVVLDPTYHLGVFAAGLVTSTGTPFFLNTYTAVATPFNPETPTPTTFQEFIETLDSFAEAPYVIPLTGGGSLSIHDFGPATPTASLVAVPEPTMIWTIGVCATAVSSQDEHRTDADHQPTNDQLPPLLPPPAGARSQSAPP